MRSAIAILVVCVLAVLTLAAVTSVAQDAEPLADGTTIPVLVNLYPGCGVTQADADRYIAEANKFLKPAKFKLVRVKPADTTPEGDDGDGGGTAGDGDFTGDEGDNVQEEGGKELNKLRNQKGIKLSFGNDPWSKENLT